MVVRARAHLNLANWSTTDAKHLGSTPDVMKSLKRFHAEAARARGGLMALKQEAEARLRAMRAKGKRRLEACQSLVHNYERFRNLSRAFHAWRRLVMWFPAAVAAAGATTTPFPRASLRTPTEIELIGDIGMLREQLRSAGAKKRAQTPGPDFDLEFAQRTPLRSAAAKRRAQTPGPEFAPPFTERTPPSSGSSGSSASARIRRMASPPQAKKSYAALYRERLAAQNQGKY